MSEKANENVKPAKNVKIEGLDFEIWLVRHTRILLKQKKTIAIVTAICLVIGLLLSIFVMKPLYASEAKFLVKIPLNIETPYGIFIFPSQNLSEYADIETGTRAIKMTYNDLKSQYPMSQLNEMIDVTIKNGIGLITFSIVVKTGDPAEAAKIADLHMNNYLELINFSFRRIAVNTFMEVKKREVLISGKAMEEFDKNLVESKTTLAAVPKTIILENALLDKNQAALYAAGKTGDDLKQFQDHILLTQVVNPKYDALNRLIGQIELDRNNAKNLMDLASADVEYLKAQKAAIEQARISNTRIEQPEDGLNFAPSTVFVINNPTVNSSKVSPNIVLNMIIALFIGLILGINIAFLKSYWRTLGTVLADRGEGSDLS
ncbi:MAG: Wzz/FepE/Etk N-terminal domain-containing protein [Saccharofermentanales bacterium]